MDMMIGAAMAPNKRPRPEDGQSPKVNNFYGANGAKGAFGDAEVALHKTVLCKQFNTPTGCRFADKCSFAHGEAELRAKPARDYLARSDLEQQQQQQYLMGMQQQPQQFANSFTQFAPAPAYDENPSESLQSLQMREAQVQMQIQQLEAQHLAAQQALAQQVALEQSSYEQQRQSLVAMYAQLQQRISERGGTAAGPAATQTGPWDSQPPYGMLFNGLSPMLPSVSLPGMPLPFVGMGMLGTPLRPATAPGANPIQRHRLKTSLCKQFNTPAGCRFGDKCAFAHGEAELQPKPTDHV